MYYTITQVLIVYEIKIWKKIVTKIYNYNFYYLLEA